MISAIISNQDSLIKPNHKSFFLFRSTVLDDQKNNFAFSDWGQGFRKPLTESIAKDVAQWTWYGPTIKRKNLEKIIVGNNSDSGFLEKTILLHNYDENVPHTSSSNTNLNYISIISSNLNSTDKFITHNMPYRTFLSSTKQTYLFKSPALIYAQYTILNNNSYSKTFTYNREGITGKYAAFGQTTTQYNQLGKAKYIGLSFTDLKPFYLNSVNYDAIPKVMSLSFTLNKPEYSVKLFTENKIYSSKIEDIKKDFRIETKVINNYQAKTDYKPKIVSVTSKVIDLKNYAEIKPIKDIATNYIALVKKIPLSNVIPIVKENYSTKIDNKVIPRSQIKIKLKTLPQYKVEVIVKELSKIIYSNNTNNNFKVNYENQIKQELLPINFNLGNLSEQILTNYVSDNKVSTDYKNLSLKETSPIIKNIEKFSEKNQIIDSNYNSFNRNNESLALQENKNNNESNYKAILPIFNKLKIETYQNDTIKYNIKDLEKVLYSDQLMPQKYNIDFSLISSDTLNKDYSLENLISKSKLSLINPSVFRNYFAPEEEISDLTEERPQGDYKQEKEIRVIEEENYQEEYKTKKTELEEKVEKYDKKVAEENIDEKIQKPYNAENNKNEVDNSVSIAQIAGLGLAGILGGILMGGVSVAKALTQKKEATYESNKAETIEEVIKEEKTIETQDTEVKLDYKPIEKGEGYVLWHNETITKDVLKAFKEVYNQPTTTIEHIDNKTGKVATREIKSGSIFNYVYHVLREKGLNIEIRQGYTDWNNNKLVDGLIIDLKDYEARKKDGLIIKVNGKEVPWESGKENPLLEGQYSDLVKDINVEVLKVRQGDYKDKKADTGHDGVPAWQGQVTEEYKGKTIKDIISSVKQKSEEELKEMLGEHYQTKVFVANQFCYFVDSGLSLDSILDEKLFEQYKGKEIKIMRKSYPCRGAKYFKVHDAKPSSEHPCKGIRRPLYNFLHEKKKKIELDKNNPLIGYIFPELEIQKESDAGKTVKEILEHIFNKSDDGYRAEKKKFN